MKIVVDPSFNNNENGNRLKAVLLRIHSVIWIACILFLLVNPLAWKDATLQFLLTAFGLLIIIPAGMLMRGWLSASSILLYTICIFVITAIAASGVGIRDYALMIYPIVLLFSGLTLRLRGLIYTTSLTLISISGLIVAEHSNLFSFRTITSPAWADILTVGVLVLISAWAVHATAANTRASMDQTRREFAERERAETSLKVNQSNLQAILENTDDLIWSIDHHYNLVTANPAFQKTIGEILGKPLAIGESVLAADPPSGQLLEWRGFYDKALAGEKTILITPDSAPDKAERIMEYRFGPILDSQGMVQGATIFGRDVTENKRAQEALRESERRYRLLAENISDVIWILDINEFRFTYVSPSVERLRGYTPLEVMAENAAASLTEESLKMLQTNLPIVLSRFYNGEKIEDYYVDQVEQPCKDGSTVWTETTTKFIENPATGHIEVYGVSREITQRRKIEEALRASEARYRAIVEDQTELICRFLPDSTLVFANPMFCEHFGIKNEDVSNRSFIELFSDPSRREEARLRIQKLVKSKAREVHESYLPSASGELKWLQWVDRAICNADGEVIEIQSVGRDITRYKEMQQKQQEYARVEERQRLARDLHDAVSQTLFSARLISESLIQKKRDVRPDEIWDNIENITQLISSALGEMRILLLELRPENLTKADLSSILKHLTDAAAARTNARIQLNMKELEKLPAETKVGFYRIAQEALNNAIKHANSRNIRIDFYSDQGQARLIIEDDGLGIQADEKREGTKMGMGIMRERAMEIHAELTIDCEPQTGTKITCIWKPQNGGTK